MGAAIEKKKATASKICCFFLVGNVFVPHPVKHQEITFTNHGLHTGKDPLEELAEAINDNITFVVELGWGSSFA
jgi:hypothetical protein